MVEEFLQYIASEKRYSPRTCAIYRAALEDFYGFQYPDLCAEDGSFQIGVLTPEQQKEALIFSCIRGYIASSLRNGLSPRTVNLHLSALSSYCTWLVHKSVLLSNPVRISPYCFPIRCERSPDRRRGTVCRSSIQKNRWNSSLRPKDWTAPAGPALR